MGAGKDSYSIVSFGKRLENLAVSVEKRLIGSNLKTFKEHLAPGSNIFLHCEGELWGLAQVTGEYVFEKSRVWANDIYPHRFPIEISFLTLSPCSISNGVHNVAFKNQFGAGWAYKFIFSPQPIPKMIALGMLKDIESTKKCSTSEFLLHVRKSG